jgi:hypothetical protein
VRIGPVRIQELHPARLRPDRPELLPRPERPVDHVPIRSAPQLRPHERPALAGLDVLELDDLENRPVHLYVVSVFELVGGDDGRSALSRAKFNVVRL